MICGNVTFQNIVQPFAPISAAASSSSVPCEVRTGISSLDMNGNVTNIVASTIPGTANIILTPIALRYGYIKLCLPNVSTYIRPAIIGETVRGKSIKVDIIFLPLNWNFVISHEANIPKNVLHTTAISETSIVSLIE